MTAEGWRLNPDFIQWDCLIAEPLRWRRLRTALCSCRRAAEDWSCKLLSTPGNPSAHLSSVGPASTQILAELIGRCWMASSENKCCWMFFLLFIRSKLYRQLSKIFLLWPVPFLINCWYVCVQEVKKAYLFLSFWIWSQETNLKWGKGEREGRRRIHRDSYK